MKQIKPDEKTIINYFEGGFEEFVQACEVQEIEKNLSKNNSPHKQKFHSMKNAKGNWYGNVTHQEAIEKARTGINLDIEALEIRDKISTEIQTTIQETMEHSVAGGIVDVGAFLSGEPECMIDIQREEVQSKNTVNIIFNMGASAGVSAEKMRWTGIAMLGLTDALENSGKYNVNLYWASAWSRNMNDKNSTWGAALFNLSSPDCRYDPQALGFALAHPAMLRHLLIGFHQSLPTEDRIHIFGDDPRLGYPATLDFIPDEIDSGDLLSNNGIMLNSKDDKFIRDEQSAKNWILKMIHQIED